MSAASRIPRAPNDDDDDLPASGTPIQDPVLHKVKPGPDAEPPIERLLKDRKGGDEESSGGPVAGRTTLEEARRKGPKGFLQSLGPGLITGASDDDPSGIGTYSQAGAQLGYSIGWTMLLTFPLMAAIQEISARMGRVTGHGIAGNVCRNFPAPVMWS